MDTPKLDLLTRAMQAYTMRLQALAGNISNLDTPGYQRLSVSFEDSLQAARLGQGGPEAGAGVSARVEVEERAPLLEDELMELADTQMRTQLAARALHGHFQAMRTAITGRTG